MTSGSATLKNFSNWAVGGLKSKKRQRSGSGGSKDHCDARKKSLISKIRNNNSSKEQHHDAAGSSSSRRSSTNSASASSPTTSCNLEVEAPVTSDIEFKFTWPIEAFLKQAANIRRKSKSSEASSIQSGDDGEPVTDHNPASSGLDSKPFEININGMRATWNLSIRFWTGENGERLANPFVLCLNMLSSTVDAPVEVGIRFRFGVLNRMTGDFEMGSCHDKKGVALDNSSELKSVGFRNVAIGDQHLDPETGDLRLVCKMKVLKEDDDAAANHSLSSDLRGLLKDGGSTSDLLLEARNGKCIPVHRNILVARSPVFAELLRRAEEEEDIKVEKLRITDVRPETLEELVDYIYTDSSACVDRMARTLLAASELYQLPGLKTHCEKHLGEMICPNNVANVLLLAEKYKCQDLKRHALDYCKDNHTHIMKDADWKTIEEEKPDLFEEAVAGVVAESDCDAHTECLKKGGKRFEIERNSSAVDHVGGERQP